jgi:hypothetical protein
MNTYSFLTHVLCVDLGTAEKDPTFSSQKGTDVHTTSGRNLRDTRSFSCQLILHFKLIINILVLTYKQSYVYLFFVFDWYAKRPTTVAESCTYPETDDRLIRYEKRKLLLNGQMKCNKRLTKCVCL